MSVPPYPAYPPPPARSRPIGVTILAVLTILLGVLILLAGIVLIVAPLVLVGVGFPPAFGLAASVFGGIVLIVGIIWIAVGAGLLNLRPWAWWLAIIVMILSIVGSFSTVIGAIIPGLILIYLILWCGIISADRAMPRSGETFLAVCPFERHGVVPLLYTRFEKARILGARALQISMGAPSILPTAAMADPLEIAIHEFASGTAPLNVSRFAHAFD